MEDLSKIVFIDTSELPCANGYDQCSNRERTISYATFVDLPEEISSPDLRYKECCYQALVLADDTGTLSRNDFTGYWYSRQLTNEICNFILIDLSDNQEYDLIDSTYGVFTDFNGYSDQPNLSTFILDWSKVLADLGEGSYQVRKDIRITGIEYSELQPVYTLKTYNDIWADKTVRIDVNMGGLLEHYNVDFTGTGYKTSLRVGGFFGRREPKEEQDNIVYRTKKVVPISMKQTNEYQFQTELLPECITELLFDFILFADEIFMNDYNLNNHSYKFKNKEVVLSKNSGTKYDWRNRRARVNLVFGDRYLNKNKYNY